MTKIKNYRSFRDMARGYIPAEIVLSTDAF